MINKLSEQQLADMRIYQAEGYPEPDDDISRLRAIRDVGRLLQHIDAITAELAQRDAWAKLWKRAAKEWRAGVFEYLESEFPQMTDEAVGALDATLRDLHGGHVGQWMDVDGEPVHVLADPAMSDETARALAEVVRAARRMLDSESEEGE